MDTMLELRDQPEELKRGGAKTMTEMVDRFHRSLDNIDRVTDALLECGTGKEFIERVQFSAASHASDRQSAASPTDTWPLDALDVGRVRDADARTFPPGSTAVPGTIRREWGMDKGSTFWADYWSRQKPKTMAELVDKFQRSLDELFERGAREGARQILRRQIARRFSDHTAVQLSGLLATLTEPDRIDEVTDALIECGTGEEFIERVRMA